MKKRLQNEMAILSMATVLALTGCAKSYLKEGSNNNCEEVKIQNEENTITRDYPELFDAEMLKRVQIYNPLTKKYKNYIFTGVCPFVSRWEADKDFEEDVSKVVSKKELENGHFYSISIMYGSVLQDGLYYYEHENHFVKNESSFDESYYTRNVRFQDEKNNVFFECGTSQFGGEIGNWWYLGTEDGYASAWDEIAPIAIYQVPDGSYTKAELAQLVLDYDKEDSNIKKYYKDKEFNTLKRN